MTAEVGGAAAAGSDALTDGFSFPGFVFYILWLLNCGFPLYLP